MATVRAHSDDRQRVLDATDIVQLISEHVTLRPKGREYVGLCPFHDDHKPSMNVVPHKQIYHCFSCGAGGDAFAFVMNYHKMGFREALEHLAQRGRVELTPWRPAHGGGSGGGGGDDGAADGRSSRAAVLGANLTANDYFRRVLVHPEHGRVARELIARRGISPDMVEHFALGAAMDRWDGLLQTVQKKRLPLEPFFAAGLLKQREGDGSGAGGGGYDAFRNRLIFPITDQIGRVIAFGGRRLSDEKRADGSEDAKYLNSAESVAFDKSSTLFGLHQATPEIRRTRTAIVTEGYMDTIACHQAGITNAVAALGTALTPANAKILRRQCETVVLLFDGDEAGQRAAEKAVEVFFAEPVDVRIAMLSPTTDAKDPDELLKREDGLEVFRAVLGAAVDPLSLLMQRISADLAGRGVSARSRVIEEFINRLVDLGLSRVDAIRYQLIVKRLASVAGVEWDVIVQTVNKRVGAMRPGRSAAAASAADADAAPAKPGVLERLLGCILCDPSLLYSLKPEESGLLRPEAFSAAPVRAVARAVHELLEDGTQPSLHAVLATLEDAAEQRAATALASDVDRLAERTISRVHELWNHWLASLRRDLAYKNAVRPSPAAKGSGGGAENSGEGGGGGDWDAILAQVEALRTLSATIGNDPAAMPTPFGRAAPSEGPGTS